LATHPNDGLIHGQIAMTFLIHANTDSKRRPQLLKEAAYYFERSLQVAPNDALTFQDAAWGLMTIGDMSPNELRCRYYRQADAILHRQERLLIPEQFSIHGQNFSTGPLRNVRDKTAAQIKSKLTGLQCEQASDD
jgi:hypothetical protein